MSLLRRAVPLEEQIVLDRLLDDAFAPARSRTVTISAARVRARVAWEREAPVSARWRAVALLGRLGDGSLALGMTAILFAGSLGAVGGRTESVQPEHGSEYMVRVRAPLDDSTFLRLLRLGRAALLSDDNGRATALRPPEDEAESVMTIRERQGLRRSATAPRPSADDGEPVITVRERQGLRR